MYVHSPDVIATDLGDELILLDPRNGEMFALNRTGRLVWLSLPAPTEQLAEAVVAAFDVTGQQALTDVTALLADLEAAELLGRTDSLS